MLFAVQDQVRRASFSDETAFPKNPTQRRVESDFRSMKSWDIFCAVVDNFGDIGVCWRLARQLCDEHGFSVRLWIDDLQTFARMDSAIQPHESKQMLGSIEIRHWTAQSDMGSAADVVIEAFGCELPERYLAAMLKHDPVPVWIDLEYLSAELWVEDCHLLASPHPRLPLKRYFFYPGFTEKTGGLLRERDLFAFHAKTASTDSAVFWGKLGVPVRDDDELQVSLFCYHNPALPDLLQAWSSDPRRVKVMVFPGAVRRQISDWFQSELLDGKRFQQDSLTVHAVPWLSHTDYDRLLRLCDVNFVRGEDSFVRAQWAQRPFVWQIYPQEENAHLVKLDAFLGRYLQGISLEAGNAVRRLWSTWNGAPFLGPAWSDFRANLRSIQAETEHWSSQLDRMSDLADNLVRFVREK